MAQKEGISLTLNETLIEAANNNDPEAGQKNNDRELIEDFLLNVKET